VEPLDDERANLTLRPGDIIHILEGGTTLAQLTIGNQRMEGVWDETLQNLTRSNVKLGQLALSFTQAPVSAVLGSLEFSQTLERFEDDTWRSEQNLELGQLELRIAALTVGLERIEGNFSVDGRQFDTLRALNGQLLELLDNAPMPDADNENMEILALTGKIYQLFNRLDANLKTINLTLVESDEPLAALGRVAMNGRYQARDDVNPAMLSYAFEMDRLQLGATSLPAGIAPTTARLEINIGNIPAELLDRLGEIALAGAQIEDESARRSYLNRQLLALLMGSRFRFQLTDSFISAPEARVDVNLRSAIEPTATFGGTGQLDLRIEGLQKLIDATGALDQEGMGIVLSILTVFSNRDQENGQVIDNYALEVTREGSVKLNGKDITALLLPSQPTPPQPRR
jgi:hypothetical protein